MNWLEDPTLGIVKHVRPSQVAMSKRVAQIAEEGGFAFLEAATGVGKSFSYLTRAIDHAVANDKRVVVSTAAKTLQDQLFTKDLPYLSEKMRPVKFAVLKGKSNYLCKLRTEQSIADQGDAIVHLPIYGKFSEWAAESPTGDLSTFPDEIPFEYLVNIEECVWKNCTYAPTCGYLAAKKAAEKAQILVVNHHLLAYDLQAGGKKMLGDYDMLIIDEGHKLPEAVRSAWESKLSLGTPKRLEKLLAKANFDGVQGVSEINGIFNDLFHALAAHPPGEWNAREHEVKLIRDAQKWMSFVRKLTVGERKVSEDDDADDRKDLRKAALTSFFDRVSKTYDALLETDDEGNSPFLSIIEDSYFQGRPQRELVAKPVEVGPLLFPALQNIGKVVVTSATLSVGGRFGYTFNEYGLAEKQVKVAEQFESNFNYKTGGILYIPPNAPLFDYSNRERDLDLQCVEIEHLVKESRGGAFILCASRSDMTHFYSYLARNLDPNETPVAQQGRSIDQDIAWFKATKGATLIGMKSLWEGVDVQGFGLRLVVIPRVPFPNRGDALLAARKRLFIERCLSNGMDQKGAELKAFNEFDVMMAGTDIAQGVGRLIRSESDKGVVAILDGRMHMGAKKYSGVLRSCIPHAFTNNKALVHKFLGMCADQADKLVT